MEDNDALLAFIMDSLGRGCESNGWRVAVIEALTESREEERKRKTDKLARVLHGPQNSIFCTFKNTVSDSSLSTFLETEKAAERDEQGRNVLHYLAASTSPGADALMRKHVQQQLGNGPVKDPDVEGFTPLHIAAAYGAPANVKTLLELGAVVDMKNKDGCTPLWFACFTNHPECAELLLWEGADVEGFSAEPCLYIAACVGSVQLCKMLVNYGADVNCRDVTGMTPVIGASENGNADALSYLLASGGRASDRDEDGDSALYKASKNCHTLCVKLLLENGADAQEARSESAQTRAAFEQRPVCGLLTMPCQEGNVDTVRLLLQHGASPEGAHPTEFPLMIASAHNHMEVCQTLVEAGASVNRVAVGAQAGATALIAALQYSHLRIASFLLDNGADIHYEGEYGNALTMAARTGKIDTVKFVLDHGGKCADGRKHPLAAAQFSNDIEMGRYLLENVVDVKEIKGPMHPFLLACAKQLSAFIDLYLEHGVGPNVEALGGQNALFQAASQGNTELIEKLLQCGANIDGQDGQGLPLAIAAKNHHLPAVKLLVSKGAKVNVEARPLIMAIDDSNVDIALYLLEAGADPHYPCKGGQNALWRASYHGYTSLVRALLAKGADVGGDKEAAAPIIVAAQNGHLEVIKVLVEAGADVNSENGKTTVLASAVENDRYECVEYLLDRGAIPKAPDSSPLTPLDRAFVNDHVREEMIVLLVRHGATLHKDVPLMCLAARKSVKAVQLLQQEGFNLSVVAADGNTPLHFAVTRNETTEVIRYLAEQGCDLEAKNEDGMSPLFLAVVNEQDKSVAALFGVGADPSSLQVQVRNHSPAEVCARNAKLGFLLSQATSPSGVSHRAFVLSKRREALTTREDDSQGHPPSAESPSVPASTVVDTADTMDTSSFESWTNAEVVAWARSIKLHADAISLIESYADFDGVFLGEATFEDLADFLKMSPISARRLIKKRDSLCMGR
mmetsp:Transcript_21250/g.55281  ORF Transcript_21250/g.55281 Transcript_21250/m.55281 type:complete len:965 (-) Transcript_21250:169-3063(-)